MKSLSVLTMALYSVASLGVNMVNAFSNAALPLYLATYRLPNVAIGFLAQERSFVGAFVQPVVGAISDRIKTPLGKRRPFFLAGVPLTAVSLLFLAAHPPLWAVLALLLVFSFFLAIANDPYLALMPDITPPQQRGRMGAAMALFNMMGQVLMLLLASFLWEKHEPLVFYLIVGGLISTFAITFFAIREPPARGGEPPRVRALRPLKYLRDVLSYREVAKYVASQFFFWFGGGAAVPFLTRFGVEVLKVGEGTAFLLVMVAVLSTAIFSIPAGIAGDRLGKKRTLSLGLLLYAAVVLPGSQTQTVSQGVVVMALVGMANAVTTTLAFPLLADLMPPGRAGEFTGLGSMVWSLAQPLGSTSAGAVVDLSRSYRSVFVVTGIMMLISYALLRGVRPERAFMKGAREQKDQPS